MVLIMPSAINIRWIKIKIGITIDIFSIDFTISQSERLQLLSCNMNDYPLLRILTQIFLFVNKKIKNKNKKEIT